MTNSPLTTRETLRGKPILLGGAVLALAGILLALLSYIVSVYAQFSTYDNTYISVDFLVGHWWWTNSSSEVSFYPFMQIFSTVRAFSTALLTTLPLFIAIGLLIFYIVFDHKKPFGTWLIPFTTAAMSLAVGATVIRFLATQLTYALLLEDPAMITRWIDPITATITCLAFLGATVAWLISPKAGKILTIISAVLGVLGTVIALVVYWVQQIIYLIAEKMEWETITLHSGSLFSTIWWIAWMILFITIGVMMILNRFSPVFVKKNTPAKADETDCPV